MIVTRCIQKFRDEKGKIKAYRLTDSNGNIKDVTPDELKIAIKNDLVSVVNLTLTSDNRLIDSNRKQLQNNINSNTDDKKQRIEELKMAFNAMATHIIDGYDLEPENIVSKDDSDNNIVKMIFKLNNKVINYKNKEVYLAIAGDIQTYKIVISLITKDNNILFKYKVNNKKGFKYESEQFVDMTKYSINTQSDKDYLDKENDWLEEIAEKLFNMLGQKINEYIGDCGEFDAFNCSSFKKLDCKSKAFDELDSLKMEFMHYYGSRPLNEQLIGVNEFESEDGLTYIIRGNISKQEVYVYLGYKTDILYNYMAHEVIKDNNDIAKLAEKARELLKRYELDDDNYRKNYADEDIREYINTINKK